MTEKERLERAKRVLAGLAGELADAKKAMRGNAPIEAMEKKARVLTEYGAMLYDIANGREPTTKASTTKRVRRALGYTYP